jgi:hypothetical protein
MHPYQNRDREGAALPGSGGVEQVSECTFARAASLQQAVSFLTCSGLRCDRLLTRAARWVISSIAVKPSFPNAFRMLVLLALAAHVFYMYCLARTNAETFGFDLGTTVVAVLFALAMLVPLVWAVTIPELPEIYTTHWRARRWWSQGRCPSCGYRTEGLNDSKCPECGELLVRPRGYRINRHTIILFVLLNAFAWAIGCAAGETWLEIDEAAFRSEIVWRKSKGHQEHARNWRWPGQGVFLWNSSDDQAVRTSGLVLTRDPRYRYP